MQNSFVMPQEQETFETASIFERTVALLLDVSLFLSAYLWCFYFLLTKTSIVDSAFMDTMYTIVFNAAFILYCGFFSSGGRQTLGKWLTGIKVVQTDGADLSFAKGIIRAIGYYVNVITLFGGFLLAIVNKNSRALEDILAGSKVISVREKTAGEATLLSAFGTILIGLVIFYMYFTIYKMPTAYQRSLVAAAQNQVEQIAQLEDAHKQNFGYYTPDLVRLSLISGDAVQLQRDIQENLRRRGFSIGITKDGYKITGIAKDDKNTEVTIEK